MLTKKVMVLFEPEKYKKLEKYAFLHETSVGALIRESVEKVILKDDLSKEKRIKAAQRLVSAEEDMPEWEELEKTFLKVRSKGNK